jgi:hypothetical protein
VWNRGVQLNVRRDLNIPLAAEAWSRIKIVFVSEESVGGADEGASKIVGERMTSVVCPTVSVHREPHCRRMLCSSRSASDRDCVHACWRTPNRVRFRLATTGNLKPRTDHQHNTHH